jgi:hypothetical protein
MCDLAYVNFLREKVRNQEAEERRTAIFGITPRVHFVPWIMPKSSRRQCLQRSNETNDEPTLIHVLA